MHESGTHQNASRDVTYTISSSTVTLQSYQGSLKRGLRENHNSDINRIIT